MALVSAFSKKSRKSLAFSLPQPVAEPPAGIVTLARNTAVSSRSETSSVSTLASGWRSRSQTRRHLTSRYSDPLTRERNRAGSKTVAAVIVSLLCRTDVLIRSVNCLTTAVKKSHLPDAFLARWFGSSLDRGLKSRSLTHAILRVDVYGHPL